MRYKITIEIECEHRSIATAADIVNMLPDANRLVELFGISVPAILPIKWRLPVGSIKGNIGTIELDEK